jgi:endo-1,4-beta-xylanase
MKYILFYLRKNIKRMIALQALLMIFAGQSYGQIGWGGIQTNVPELKNVYAKDFYIGCLLSYNCLGFKTDPYVTGQSAVLDTNGGYLIKYHMNSMSPGNNMKPQYTVNISASAAAYVAATTQAQKDSIDTHPIVSFNGDIIAQLNWAKRQGFTFRGHTLVWHNQTPTQFFRSGYTSTGTYLTKDKMIQRMDWYMHEVFRLIHENWSGVLSAFDVVNEAIDDNTGRIRTTGNEWYAVFDDSSYVMTAFQIARKYTEQYGETQIKLYYNDYNTDNPTKADGIVNLLTPIYQAGYLDGIGMQEHNNLSSPVTAQSFIATYNKFYPICNEMAVTELDVATGSATPTASVLAKQANEYGMLFKCFVERSYKSGRGKIINVSKDGLNDTYTFQKNQSSSLWDGNDQCKPAFYAVVDVGTSYNALDSIITYADSLQETKYTPISWSHFSTVLDSAKNAMTQEYSVSVSADTALSNAKTGLQGAIADLVEEGTKIPFLYASTNVVNFGAVAEDSTGKDSVSLINFGTDTLKITSIVSTNTSFTTTQTALNISPSDSSYLTVVFAPKDTSRQSGFIILTYNAAGSPDSIAVSGKGLVQTAVTDKAFPSAFSLSQNYPNPFNPTTVIGYQLPSVSHVSLRVYDVLGREVATLVNEKQNSGYYNVTFNAGNLPSGMYFYKIATEKFSAVKKLILVK